MKTLLGRLAAATLALALGLGSAVAAGIDYRVVSFGDSLSDTGNLNAIRPLPNVYAMGRFSNGPVWTEILAGGAMRLVGAGRVDNGRDANWAFGGATAVNAGQVPPIPYQISGYFGRGGRFAARDVATLLGGANELLALPIGAPPQLIAGTAAAVADAQAANIGKLIAGGARRIVVANLPPLGLTPRGLGNPALGAVLASATDIFNARLAANLTALGKANPKVRIVAFDLNALFMEMAADPARFGFANTTHPCLLVGACVGGGAAAQKTFVFWDDIHPTTAAHAVIAQRVRSALWR